MPVVAGETIDQVYTGIAISISNQRSSVCNFDVTIYLSSEIHTYLAVTTPVTFMHFCLLLFVVLCVLRLPQ